MTHDEIIAAIVKPPIWDEGQRYSDARAWLSFNEKGRFCYGVDLAGIFYMQTPDGEEEGFDTLAAAKAAAEADYRTRKAADLYVEKIAALVEAVNGLAAVLNRNEAKGPPRDEELVFCWLAAQDVRAKLIAMRGKP